jgi:uncharacterized repeat protein (TIGR01451 family)
MIETNDGGKTMKRMRNLLLVLFVFGLMAFNANALTSALSLLTNTAMVTAQNAPVGVVDFTNITTATMWGGVMYVRNGTIPGLQQIGNNQRFKWVIQLSNLGNSPAIFDLEVRATNFRRGGGLWGWSFTNVSPVRIGVGSFSNIGFIISNRSPASNLAYFGCLIQASNRSAPLNARAYLGWGATGLSNVNFGGTLAVRTNGNIAIASWGPVVVPQHGILAGSTNRWAGFLMAQIAGPVLTITKSIVSISHSSGLYTGDLLRAEPGAMIVYKIYITNSGSRAATNVKVIDTVQTNFLAWLGATSIVSQGRTFTNATGALVGNKITFNARVSSNFKLNANVADRIYIRVRVR